MIKKEEGIMKIRTLFATVSSAMSALLAGCAASTSEINAVDNFEPQRYMGIWYEIARLPHSFERGTDFVSAEYSLQPDGSIRVINRGMRDGKKTFIEGKAKLKDRHSGKGELKVSFFGPFYGAYRIIELPSDYSYAVVTGSRKNFLWILSRTSKMPESQLHEILKRLKFLGFETEKLEYPKQQ